MKYVLYPLAAFGAYTVAVLAIFHWWTRQGEINELLGQISDTPAPPVRPALVDSFCRQMQAAMDRHHCEQLEHEWKADR